MTDKSTQDQKDLSREEIKQAYATFLGRVDEITLAREAEISVLGAKVNEIEENTWVESISIWANNLRIDGITLNELYPDCVEVIKG